MANVLLSVVRSRCSRWLDLQVLKFHTVTAFNENEGSLSDQMMRMGLSCQCLHV